MLTLLLYIFIAAAAFVLIRRFLERRRNASDTSKMDSELERIYRKLGAPDGFGEAKAKITALAD